MVTVDYVRWMGIAAWTCGLAIPRHTLGLSLAPGESPGHISIQCAGGRANTLEVIEREYTHIQWLLAGSPRDETSLDYIYQQQLCITGHTLTNCTFAVVDFRERIFEQGPHSRQHRDYSPEASLLAARDFGTTKDGAALSDHIPPWRLAEPLGLLALAVREYFTDSVVRELTQEYVDHLNGDPHHTSGSPGYGRLAYSVEPHHGTTCQSTRPLSEASTVQHVHDASQTVDDHPTEPTTTITLHALADDPLFTEAVLEHLIDRSQAFATAFVSGIDCRKVFQTISVHTVFPSTVHEPDAEGVPIILYRIPLRVDLLPSWSLPLALSEDARSTQENEDILPLSASSSPGTPRRRSVVLHRALDSGIVKAYEFIPGQTLVNRSVQWGGYLTSAQVISQLQCECSTTDPGCLAARATSTIIWESLATWGVSADAWAGGVNTPDRTDIGAACGRDAVRTVHPKRVSMVKNSIDQPLVTIEVDARAPLGSVVHDVCDALDALGVEASMDFPIELVWSAQFSSPHSRLDSTEVNDETCDSSSASYSPQDPHSPALCCLWPRALGSRRHAATDQALALAVVRQALRDYVAHGVSWIGVLHSRVSPSDLQDRITVAMAHEGTKTDLDKITAELTSAINTTCATSFPGSQIVCEVVDSSQLADVRQWGTAAGYHPVYGFLPSYIHLERVSNEHSSTEEHVSS